MAKQGFYYDQQKCVGCKTCQIACKDKNDLPLNALFRRVSSYSTGSFPHPSLYNFTMSCNHCINPACVEVCPIGSLYVDEGDGTVQRDDSMCIGCQYCVNACPYQNPRYVPEKQIVQKCDACITLRQSGEVNACVASCPMRALEFGPIDELLEAHPQAVNAIALLPDPSSTNPCLYINAKEAALLDDYKEIIF